jgi:excisionase family DNA binding protein
MNRRSSNPPRRSASTASSPTSDAAARKRPLNRLLTINETAEILNASSRTVRRLIDSGALPVHRIGRLVRISNADIATLLAATRRV